MPKKHQTFIGDDIDAPHGLSEKEIERFQKRWYHFADAKPQEWTQEKDKHLSWGVGFGLLLLVGIMFTAFFLAKACESTQSIRYDVYSVDESQLPPAEEYIP